MDKILNITINILIVLWMLLCIGIAILMYDEIPRMGSLSWYSLQRYLTYAGILVSWFTLGGIISILALKYPAYRIYVSLHFIPTMALIVLANIAQVL